MSTQSNRKKFASYNREQYADWLWRGLRSFYASQPSERMTAFEYVGRLITQQESVCEGLARVYQENVPEARKLLFRQAVGDVLREQGNNLIAPVDAFRDLIYLLGRIRATESLDALLPTVGVGSLGKLHPEVLYETLAVLKSLAPSNYAYRTADALVDSSNFDDGYLFEALKVLVECNPSEASTIIRRLLPRLNQLRDAALNDAEAEWDAFCEAAEDWAQHVISTAPSSWIKDFWGKTDHSSNQEWVFELFFSNDAIPVDLIRDPSSKGFLIEYFGKPIDLAISEKDHWTRRVIERNRMYKQIRAWVSNPTDLIASLAPVKPSTNLRRVLGSIHGAQQATELGLLFLRHVEKLMPSQRPRSSSPE